MFLKNKKTLQQPSIFAWGTIWTPTPQTTTKKSATIELKKKAMMTKRLYIYSP
jgi:hypothetical protein